MKVIQDMNKCMKTGLALASLAGIAAFSCAADTFYCDGNVENVWTAAIWNTNSQQVYPSFVGDVANIGTNSTLTLDIDPVLSGFAMVDGRILNDGAVRSITFRQSDPETPVPLTVGGNGESHKTLIGADYSGENVDSVDIVLDGDIACDFPSTSGNMTSSLYLNGRLRGGSVESPAHVTFTKADNGWTHAEVFLMRNDNDFRADMVFRSGTGDWSTMEFRIGQKDSLAWSDSALGHPDNQFTLLGGYASLVLTMFDTERGLRHRINGNGSIKSQSYDSWYVSHRRRLALDEGFVASPCAENSEYGTLTICAKPVEWRTNAVYRVDVGFDSKEEPVSDSIRLMSEADNVEMGAKFYGRIDIVSSGTIPDGTAYTIMTVDKTAKAFDFNPSSVTPGWNLMWTGDADNGWKVVATKAREGVDVCNYPVSLIADDHVTANCEVLDMGGMNAVGIRLYYGLTDGGADASAWDAYVDYPAATATGLYSAVVPNLTEGKTYYFRHAVVVDGEPVFSLDHSVSCATVPVSRPDSFTWVTGTADWDATGVWSINTPYERQTPGYARDLVRFVYEGVHASMNPQLAEDRTVGNVYCDGGAWDRHWELKLSTDNSSKLVFDNGGEVSKFEVYKAGLDNAWLGTSPTDGLVLQLNNDLTFLRNSDFTVNFRVFAKVTGGTAADPRKLTFVDMGNEYAKTHFYLLNPDNDFVGPVSLERTDKRSVMTLHLGGEGVSYTDSLLGDPSNPVSLQSYTELQVGSGVGSVAWTRPVSGAGTLNSLSSLALGAVPVTTELGGVFTVKSAATLSDSGSTTYRIPLDPEADPADANAIGKIAFEANASLTLDGFFSIEPTDPTAKIARGATWTIGSIAASAGSLGRDRFSATRGWHVRAEGDAESGWTLVAEHIGMGFAVSVR